MKTAKRGLIGSRPEKRGKMNGLDRLDYLMQRALQKCQSEKLRSVVDAMRELLPDVLKTLQSLSVDPSATTAQRIHAAELILGIHARVIAADNEYERTEAIKAKSRAISEAARAAKMTARAEAKKQDNEVARVRRRYARALAKAEVKKEETQTQ